MAPEQHRAPVKGPDGKWQPPAWAVPGARFRFCRQLHHVVAVLDGEGVAITKRWMRSRQRWHYEGWEFYLLTPEFCTRIRRAKNHNI